MILLSGILMIIKMTFICFDIDFIHLFLWIICLCTAALDVDYQ